MLINNATYQRETLSERPIRQPLSEWWLLNFKFNNSLTFHKILPCAFYAPRTNFPESELYVVVIKNLCMNVTFFPKIQHAMKKDMIHSHSKLVSECPVSCHSSLLLRWYEGMQSMYPKYPTIYILTLSDVAFYRKLDFFFSKVTSFFPKYCNFGKIYFFFSLFIFFLFSLSYFPFFFFLPPFLFLFPIFFSSPFSFSLPSWLSPPFSRKLIFFSLPKEQGICQNIYPSAHR